MYRILIPILVISLVGCGGVLSGKRSTVTLQGTVSLDGTPVDEGTISFEPKDGKGGSVSAQITDGNFETRIEPGVKIVKINSPKMLRTEPAYPGSPDSPMIEVSTEQIPAKYNSPSRLEKDLTEVSGPVSFELTSK